MLKDKPRKDDLVLTERPDSGWVVVQDGLDRLPGGAGLHLTDRDRAEEVAYDIGECEKVDVWLLENGRYSLLKTYRATASV